MPIVPAWLLNNQCFIKLIHVTNLCSVQEYYPTAFTFHDAIQNTFQMELKEKALY